MLFLGAFGPPVLAGRYWSDLSGQGSELPFLSKDVPPGGQAPLDSRLLSPASICSQASVALLVCMPRFACLAGCAGTPPYRRSSASPPAKAPVV
jgi:hypothetical protein